MPPAPCSILLITGVAGSGKTTIGRRLATELGWPYHEADDFHSAGNKAKMASGLPLDDADRVPWLAAIHAAMADCAQRGRSAVFTCSALKASYRRQLADGLPGLQLVFLTGDRVLLEQRLQSRPGHYMKAGMLDSQLATLEPPTDALTLKVDRPPEELVAEIKQKLSLEGAGES